MKYLPMKKQSNTPQVELKPVKYEFHAFTFHIYPQYHPSDKPITVKFYMKCDLTGFETYFLMTRRADGLKLTRLFVSEYAKFKDEFARINKKSTGTPQRIATLSLLEDRTYAEATPETIKRRISRWRGRMHSPKIGLYAPEDQ